jgi:hypothetical protein
MEHRGADTRASLRHQAVWLVAAAVSILILIGPALWNGFPLLQYDTGGYLARWYEGTLTISRSVPYGLLLTAGHVADFWPVVIVQSAAAVWVLAVLLRVHGLGRPLILVTAVALLSLTTALPWLSSILLTDIFAGLGVLAIYMIVLRAKSLARWERIGLFVLAGYAGATHNATLAVMAGLVLVAAIVSLPYRRLVPLAGIAAGLGALALAVAIVLVANVLVARRLAWTPGGFALSFGRMLQDGIVARYLAAHCPDPRLQLCQYRHELTKTADEFFWGSDLFDRLGRFRGLGPEMKTIALGCLAEYPLTELETAITAAARQLVSIRTGEGTVNSIWHTYAIIKQYTPDNVADMQAARQQRTGLDFSAINTVHVSVALASLALLLAVIGAGWKQPRHADLGLLAATVLLALLGNAVVCGAFSNPHDRYGARMVWIAALAVGLLPCRLACGARAKEHVIGRSPATPYPQ